MTYTGPVLLGGHHVPGGFDCGKPALDERLRRRAAANHVTGSTRTWVAVVEGTTDVVAYYASCTGSVLRPPAPRGSAGTSRSRSRRSSWPAWR